MTKEVKLDIYPNYVEAFINLELSEGYRHSARDILSLTALLQTRTFTKQQVINECQSLLLGLKILFCDPQKTNIEMWHELHKVCMMGANKYGLGMYLTHPFSFQERINSALRHLKKANDGESRDDESGLEHQYHILANICMILEVCLLGGEEKIQESNDLPILEDSVTTVTDVFKVLNINREEK